MNKPLAISLLALTFALPLSSARADPISEAQANAMLPALLDATVKQCTDKTRLETLSPDGKIAACSTALAHHQARRAALSNASPGTLGVHDIIEAMVISRSASVMAKQDGVRSARVCRMMFRQDIVLKRIDLSAFEPALADQARTMQAAAAQPYAKCRSEFPGLQ